MGSVNGLEMRKWEGESRLPVSVREWCLNTRRTPSVALHFAPKPQGSNDLPPLHFISLPSLVPCPKGGEKSIKTKAWSKRPQPKHAICTGLGVSMTTAGYGCLCTIVLTDGTFNCRIKDGFRFHESHGRHNRRFHMKQMTLIWQTLIWYIINTHIYIAYL